MGIFTGSYLKIFLFFSPLTIFCGKIFFFSFVNFCFGTINTSNSPARTDVFLAPPNCRVFSRQFVLFQSIYCQQTLIYGLSPWPTATDCFSKRQTMPGIFYYEVRRQEKNRKELQITVSSWMALSNYFHLKRICFRMQWFVCILLFAVYTVSRQFFYCIIIFFVVWEPLQLLVMCVIAQQVGMIKCFGGFSIPSDSCQ